jgi:hypothetical protein
MPHASEHRPALRPLAPGEAGELAETMSHHREHVAPAPALELPAGTAARKP